MFLHKHGKVLLNNFLFFCFIFTIMLRCLNQLKILLLVAGCFIGNNIKAQTPPLLPPDQPEQDACNAVLLCSNSFYTPYSYSGVGLDSDLTSTPCGGTEMNSVWIKLNITSSGKIIFKISPVDTANDYDFAVLNSTNTTCNNLKPADVVRCNFNSNNPGSNVGGVIGLSLSSNTPYVADGTIGNSFCQAIDAVAGESYLVMINNFGNYVTPQTGSSGFTIDFTGSTAVFNNAAPPDINNVDVSCDATSIIVHLNNHVVCSSIAADGSDFISNAPIAITGVAGINCINDSSYTDSVIINFAAPLPAGNYTIQAKKGSDGNTLVNLCGNALSLPSKQIPFTILPDTVVENKFICNEKLPYVWNGISVTKGGDSVAVYTTASSGGCDSTTILNLTVSAPPAQSTLSKTICSNQSYTLPWDSTVTAAGIYMHLYKNTAGCDSLIEQVILKDSSMTAIENKSICNEQLPYVWNGISVAKGGDQAAVYTTVSSGGCDSTTILDLTVNEPPVQSTLSKAICSDQSYILPWDSTVTSAGIYTHLYKNKAGCDSIVEQVILRDSACTEYVYVPTAFTPNSDNKNDIFKPLVSGTLVQYSFLIYNRWGKIIFFSKDPLRGWDGTFGGLQQDAGTYIWFCTYQLSGEEFQMKKGTVTLIR
jgi:gliding motility-associated-like protein